MKSEPILHTHISDTLPPSHPLANNSVYCSKCTKPLHAFNNECMSSWVETDVGNFCLQCFSKIDEEMLLEDLQ